MNIILVRFYLLNLKTPPLLIILFILNILNFKFLIAKNLRSKIIFQRLLNQRSKIEVETEIFNFYSFH